MISKGKHVLMVFSLIIVATICGFLLTGCETKNSENYIINFIVDEKLYHNIISSGNESIDLPDAPQKEGYNFEGWYFIQDSIEIEFSSDYLKNKKLTSNINLYAKFNAYNLIVSLDVNGGTCDINTISVSYGEPFSLPIPIREGYDFAGWYSTDQIVASTIWDYNTSILTAKWNKIFETSGNIITGLTQYGKTLNNIEIPPKIDNENILYLDSNSFLNCTTLKTIIIPNTIEEIGLGAFAGCSNLQKITIPFIGDTEASENTFGYIFGSQKFIGSSETIQNNFSYYIPNTLREITLNGITIKPYAFYNCSSISDINILGSYTSIGNYAFYNCSNLQTLQLSENIERIGDGAFGNCISLHITNFDKITKLKEIGEWSFCNCEKIDKIVIPESVTKIEKFAFENCINVQSVYYNAINCADIKQSYPIFDSLGQNTSGTNVYIGSKVNRIPSYLFNTSISWPSSETNITNIEFENNAQCLTIGKYAFCGLNIKNFSIPKSVTEIEDYAFSSCEKLEYIILNSKGIKFNQGSFYYCDVFETIFFDGEESEFSNVLVVSSYNELINNAAKYFYSQERPLEPGNYWHYDTDNKTILKW